jgi:hypothetical protein
MNIRKMLFIAALMLAFTILLPVAHADDWNQATRVTFSQREPTGSSCPTPTIVITSSRSCAKIER